MNISDHNEKMLKRELQKEYVNVGTRGHIDYGDIDWVFEKLYAERLKQAVELPIYMIPDGLTRDEYLREYFGDWRVEKPYDEY